MRNESSYNFKKRIFGWEYFCALIILFSFGAIINANAISASGNSGTGALPISKSSGSNSASGTTPTGITNPGLDSPGSDIGLIVLFRGDQPLQNKTDQDQVATDNATLTYIIRQFYLGTPIKVTQSGGKNSKATVSIAIKSLDPDGKETVTFQKSGFKDWNEARDWLGDAVNKMIANRADYFSTMGPLITHSGKSAG